MRTQQTPASQRRPNEAGGVQRPAAEDVTFLTEDQVRIGATLYRSPDAAAPAVVLVHQLSSARTEWASRFLPALTRGTDFSVLAIDMRGHGESSQRGQERLSWSNFSTTEWRNTSKDVVAAVGFLASQSPAPRKIAVVGASIGSSAAIDAASKDPRIAALVLLSPGRAYHGFDAVTPFAGLGSQPVMAVAAEGETASVETVEEFARLRASVKKEIVAGEAHGVRMAENNLGLPEKVRAFLLEALR